MPARPSLILIALLAAQVSAAEPKLDAHGFPLPEGAIARIGDLRYAQSTRIDLSDLSADGRLVATASLAFHADEKWRSEIHIWDADNGRILRTIEANGFFSTLAFSPDGLILAGSTNDGNVFAWKTKSGKSHWEAKDRRPDSKLDCSVLKFIENGRKLACLHQGSRPSPGVGIRLWDVEQGTLEREYGTGNLVLGQDLRSGTEHELKSATLSPSGVRMAWLVLRKGRDPAVLVHDTRTGRLLDQVSIRGFDPALLHLLDEGDTVLLQTHRRNAVFRLADGRENFQFPYSSGGGQEKDPFYVSSLMAVPHGTRTFLVWNGDSFILLDMDTGKFLSEKTHADLLSLATKFSSDGKRALAVSGSRWVLLNERMQPLSPVDKFSHAPSIHFDSDSRLVLNDDAQLQVWDPRQRKCSSKLVFHGFPTRGGSMPLTDPTGRFLVYLKSDECLFVADRVTKREACLISGEQASFTLDPQISQNGHRVLIPSKTDEGGLLVRWFDTLNGNELGRYVISKKDGHENGFRDVKWYASDGSIFGFTAPDCRLTLIDCKTRQPMASIGVATLPAIDPKHGFPAWRYWPEYRRFALAFRGYLETDMVENAVWEIATGIRIRRALSKDLGEISGDARLMVVCRDKHVEFTDCLTGRTQGKLQMPTRVEHAAFSPDGKLLSTSHSDTSVLLWDMNRPLGDKPALALPTSDADCDKLWQTLGDADPATAEQAVWALVRAPGVAVAYLDKKLQPVRETPRLKAMIAQLDAANFKEREAAVRELTELGELAEPALRAALADMSLEQRRRAEKILSGMDDPTRPPVHLRELRAVEVLERINNASAQRVLTRLADGWRDALLTNEARLALGRCK